MDKTRREILEWHDIDKLIDHLLPQFERNSPEFEAMVMITRGGLIPGGLLAEVMNITYLLLAAVDFPAEMERTHTSLYAWPRFLQFPENELLEGRHILVVDDVWASGRTITSVKNRILGAGGVPFTCVLHFNPQRNLFGNVCPDYYAAITDAHIVYPWEVDRGADRVFLEKSPNL
jgi:hypoxanthine phosphoribosyltransferase